MEKKYIVEEDSKIEKESFKIENDFNDLSLEKEWFIKMSYSLEGNSHDLKSGIEGFMEGRSVGRQSSEFFETKMESISEEMNEIKVNKELLKEEDYATENENNQLWEEADELQQEKDKVKQKR